MINVSIVHHKEQRYDTAGDWQYASGIIVPGSNRPLSIKVSNTGVSEFNSLLAIHEIVEAILCKNAFITEQEVDDWDRAHLDDCDPGSIKGCPYYREHLIATIIERMVADEMGVDWNEYEAALEEL